MNYKKIILYGLLLAIVYVTISCTSDDIPVEHDANSTITIQAKQTIKLVCSDKIIFDDIYDGYMRVNGGGKILLTPSQVCNFDTLGYGWHSICFYSSEDSLVADYYYHKIEKLPSLFVPESIIMEGRRANVRYTNKYKQYLKDSYTIQDDYLNSYHIISHSLFDEDGIPKDVINGVEYYHLGSITQYALSFWEEKGKMTDEDEFVFLKLANFIGEHLTPEGGAAYSFDYQMHGIEYKKPWFSGMDQGQILSLMSRAFYLTGDNKYKDYGDKILDFMINDAGDTYPYSGCRVKLGQFTQIHKDLAKYSEFVIYDEYVGSQNTYVLNGILFGLLGLYDYYEATDSQIALTAFLEGCKSIEVMIPYYDYYGSTTYDLLHLMLPDAGPRFGTYAHDFDIVILDALYKYTGNKVFAQYRDVFISYYEPSFSGNNLID